MRAKDYYGELARLFPAEDGGQAVRRGNPQEHVPNAARAIEESGRVHFAWKLGVQAEESTLTRACREVHGVGLDDGLQIGPAQLPGGREQGFGAPEVPAAKEIVLLQAGR